MGITERKEREKEQRRNDILDAAEKVFFSRGVDNATMDEVAEAAELSKGTLYLYFKSKEELYMGIHIRGHKILNDMFCQALETAGPGIQKVREIGKAYFRFSREYPNYFHALLYFEISGFDFSDQESLAYQCHLQGEACMACVTQAIQTGIEDGSIRADLDPQKTAWLLWGVSSGIIQNLATKGEHLISMHGIKPEEIVEEFFRFVYTALTSGD